MAKARQDPDSTLGLADRLHSVAIRLLRRARREDAAMGLPPAQASVLSVLVFGGARTLSALADVEQVKAPTMTRIVDALERAGLAQRQPDADDRRKLSIAATASGVRLMQKGRSRRVNPQDTVPLIHASRTLPPKACPSDSSKPTRRLVLVVHSKGMSSARAVL